ncbi:leucine--tRNA ligase [Rufibacter glacialis]|uniref:Leucine--tRNA ligase n=1 Tax=Rufibacter glacialis TaxID=1259555 RepID=A0A5M8QEA6_9BACT|nr:leucine--tRNA ligase [Rufibacter glacialis]KAA6434367.1 leucine--tRNA ligase [Rufibacter glacialis]GGK68882.1 leucine--tRNA ligase [Rufibacter glacialis]
MSEYDYRSIEQKWQRFWSENKTFKTEIDLSRPKFYSLDMFPYPSGAGLHVGHPLGYIASDIVSRYKRLKGFNVLHPMGFDSFGLPAEQYAIQTGQHPAVTTTQNINRYIEQLNNLGFSFDWDREVRTSDPSYYKWTQWIFMQLFNSWYNYNTDKAEPIDTLVAEFKMRGSTHVNAACDEDTPHVTADAWARLNEKEQQDLLLKYRLTFLSEAVVNWCPQLGTVLANDEVKDGVSERGGYPVERKLMKQWMMRITAYAERLLQGLDTIDWPEPVKEMQRNWIGKSVGAELRFQVDGHEHKHITVFTTRIDTIFGVSFVVLAPEHEFVAEITSAEQRAEVEEYVAWAKNRSERDRMSDVKSVTGTFTGAYAINPISGEKVPVWIADYVLAGYGTGAVMAVPGHDTRDYAFAKKFNLPIPEVVAGGDLTKEAYAGKEGKIINSGFLNGLEVKDAINAGIQRAEELGVGKARINFRMRDAVFGRQRYWGEPVPVYYKDGIPALLEESELPLVLPEVDAYLPTETGEPPLGRAQDWKYRGEFEYELSTMPGWAGSSWYWYRYMDAQNDTAFASKEAIDYWQNVDLYIGGSEHATGHLLYSRFWNKFLFDLGLVNQDEPFKKLINQGMIQGRSNFVYRVKDSNTFVSFGLKDQYDTTALHVDVNIVENDVLDLERFKAWRPDFANAEFILEDGKYQVGVEIEKMSKSKHNVVNPDVLVEEYGADTLRMYEMFLGPLEQFKPWNTNGMDGVYKFLRRFWKLFFDEGGTFAVTQEDPTPAELKALHKTIKKVEEDIERFSFGTSVSQFMICVNELTALKTKKQAILEPLTIALAPYAPHITEELWARLGHTESITYAAFPIWKEEYLTESTFDYPISVNGKVKTKLTFDLKMPKEEIEKEVLSSEQVLQLLDGKPVKKVIVVPGKIVNVVV